MTLCMAAGWVAVRSAGGCRLGRCPLRWGLPVGSLSAPLGAAGWVAVRSAGGCGLGRCPLRWGLPVGSLSAPLGAVFCASSRSSVELAAPRQCVGDQHGCARCHRTITDSDVGLALTITKVFTNHVTTTDRLIDEDRGTASLRVDHHVGPVGVAHNERPAKRAGSGLGRAV